MAGSEVSPHAAFRGWHSRGYLPHFDRSNAVQHVTFRLADSLPTHLLRQLETELPLEASAERRRKIAALLDAGHGSCILQNPAAAAAVQDCLQYHDGQRYRLLAWVVMPNHVHAVLDVSHGFSLSSIMKTVKNYTAHDVNQLLGRSGSLWMREYFDRLVRDEDHLWRVVEYIHMNPVTAGLCVSPELWPFSSAQQWKQRLAGGLAQPPG